MHGIKINEIPTQLQSPAVSSTGIIVAIGSSPIHKAAEPLPLTKAGLFYKKAEVVKALGYDENYTLSEVINIVFDLYNVAPIVAINVFDPSKHFDEEEVIVGGITSTPFTIEEDIDVSTIAITSGEYIEPTKLVAGTDYICDAMNLHEGEAAVVAIELLSTSKIEGGKFKVSYRRTRDALGGQPVIEEVNVSELEDNIWELTDDTIIESVTVESGGVNTLRELNLNEDYKVAYTGEEATISLITDTKIVDDTITVKYHKMNPDKVTAEDIIGGVDMATGAVTGLELIDSVQPLYNLGGNFSIIAPKYSLNTKVAAALINKARAVNGLFPSMAVIDIDAATYKNYQDAVVLKNSSNLNDSHLILCYPMVKVDDKVQFLSTHIAALMNVVDNDHDEIPYASPSNHILQISSACLADGTEVYYSQDAANLLNDNGIVTVLSMYSLRAWGNRTAAYPASTDPREFFIPVRRMFNFITAYLLQTYISTLDSPINRRFVESILQSANIWLSALVAKGALLNAELQFLEEDNSAAQIMNGELHFKLYIAPPTPAESMVFDIEINPDYYSALFE